MWAYILKDYKFTVLSKKFILATLLYISFVFLPLTTDINLLPAQYNSVVSIWAGGFNHSQIGIILVCIVGLVNSDSLCVDLRQNFTKFTASRMGSKKYILAKLIGIILPTFTLVFFSNLIAMLLLSIKFPLYPDLTTDPNLEALAGSRLLIDGKVVLFYLQLILRKMLEAGFYLLASFIISLFTKSSLVIYISPLLVYSATIIGQNTNLLPGFLNPYYLFKLYNYLEINQNLEYVLTPGQSIAYLLIYFALTFLITYVVSLWLFKKRQVINL